MKNSNYYKPRFFIMIYIITTFLLSIIGPVQYINYDWISVFFYLLFVLVAIFFGYRSAFKFNINFSSQSKNILSDGFIISVVSISIKLAMIIEIIILLSYLSDLSINSINSLFDRILDIGSVYQQALLNAKETNDVSGVRQIATLLGLSKQIAIVGYFWYRKQLSNSKKWFIIFIIIYLFNILAFKGTQKEIGDMMIYFFGVVLAQGGLRNRINLKKILIPLMAFGGCVFGAIQLSRANTYNMATNFYTDFFYFDADGLVYTIFGDTIGFALTIMTHYIAGGYYGLSKSLSMDFQWTYGIGNSFALSSYAVQYLGLDNFLQFTYPFRAEMETGYPALQYWSTIFPWLASDFTFFGVIIFMIIVARFYAISWKETIDNKNFLSCLLFTRLNIFWLFLPANNQLMQTRESAVATIFLFVIWLFYHKKANQSMEGNKGGFKIQKNSTYKCDSCWRK